MIPGEAPEVELTKLQTWLWDVARFVARHLPGRITEAVLYRVWDQATEEKYDAAMFDDLRMSVVFERVIGYKPFGDLYDS